MLDSELYPISIAGPTPKSTRPHQSQDGPAPLVLPLKPEENKTFRPTDPPRDPQESDCDPKRAPRGPQEGQRAPKGSPWGGQGCPRAAQRGAKSTQRIPLGWPRVPKRCPRETAAHPYKQTTIKQPSNNHNSANCKPFYRYFENVL